MYTVVGKFEKGRSDFKENCLRLSVVGGCHWKLLKCHGGDVVCVCTEFHSNMCYHWPVKMINIFTKKTLPEAICCCLQTCLLLIFILLIEYIMYTELHVHIALTTCEFVHCLMCPHFNVWPGAICCCLLLIKLLTKI